MDAPTTGEISGHYHPKATLRARGRRVTRPCFLIDSRRVILPAFGAFTGGLALRHPALQSLMAPEAEAVLIGPQLVRAPAASLTH
jgi:metallophosphoesterase superfamily enzyme